MKVVSLRLQLLCLLRRLRSPYRTPAANFTYSYKILITTALAHPAKIWARILADTDGALPPPILPQAQA